MNEDCFSIDVMVEKYGITKEHVEDYLKNKYCFVGKIDYLYGIDGKVGETIYYLNKDRYLKDIIDSYEINRPIKFETIKGNQKNDK